MKTIIALITCAALTSGCASPGAIADQSRQNCALMGYPSTDARFVECIERGFRGQQALQQQAQSDIATYLILDALF